MKDFKEFLTESKDQLDEALSGMALDKDFQNLNRQVTAVREGWRDIRRKVSKAEGVDRRQLSSLDDKIDDATRELASELDKVHSQLKKMVD